MKKVHIIKYSSEEDSRFLEVKWVQLFVCFYFVHLEELENDQYDLEFTSLNFCLEVNAACVTERQKYYFTSFSIMPLHLKNN